MSAEREVDRERQALNAYGLSVRQRLGIMLLSYVPLLHALSVLLLLLWPWARPGWRIVAAVSTLYLAPPLVARLLLMVAPFGKTVIAVGSRDFFTWWALLSFQVLFCRFPALEEALRIVPTLYSFWLRLWGSRIGRLVYWSAGTQVLDRSFLDIGDDVIFGAGVRLNPHVLVRNASGELELILAPVKIGARAMVGGYSLLTAGTEIMPGECLQALLVSPPFTRWKDGRRVRERE
jgi:hypothetical protein